ncbi:PAS domain-containing sensor histidine kinase [Halalkaliarchaeum sp. AArc-GB]|uniref:PAS domain-containing sensor histidine kinase n=1 Tax=Halalkaliarchaeum sp. AArc-GB TaxID=3074078 RepID=UPI00285795A7|nr:PAS domain-containing sensor histidine kinase [Halalkaliarchaeum sp. AArc-GB]MDR5674657.1 PAS domain-containing sensor histidine kinase [Halalkaliarchaeum sp. AArc-GB]
MDNGEREESERRYRRLIETSPAPINLFDASGEIIWGNDAVLDLLGLEIREELVGRSIFDFIHPEDEYTAQQELAEVVEEKRATGPTTMQLHRPDGDTRTIRVSTAPGRYHGRDIGQAVVVDITELEELRESLVAERQFVETALDTLQDVFYVIDPSGHLQRWNDTLLEVTGYDESEIEDLDVEDFFIEEHTDRVSRSITTAFAEGEDTLTATLLTKRGATVPFEFRKRRLLQDGEVAGLVGIGRDVSARQERERHLRIADRVLQHNMRNQLNIVQGAAMGLGEGLDGADRREIERITDATDRLLSIFDNHHRIVELLTERHYTEAIDAVELVASIGEQFDDEYPDACVEYELPEAALVSTVPALEQALQELVENALEHNDSRQPTVELAVEPGEMEVEIHVRDDGPRIPEIEYRTKQHDEAGSPTFHSAGLGLWFVHWVVTRSGGTVTFAENDPAGNLITIALPAAQSRWR